MKNLLTRLAGIAFVVAGVAGLVFCVVSIVALASAEKRVEKALVTQIDLLDRTVTTTGEGLDVADRTLAQAVSAVQALEGTAAGLGEAMQGAMPTLDAAALVLGDQLPATIRATQQTLSSVATSAKAVDDIMAALATVPLLRLDIYSPEVPLYRGVEQVAASLDGIPESMVQAGSGLTAAGDSLELIQREIDTMSTGVGAIAASLGETQAVLREYQDMIVELQRMVDTVREGLPTWLRWARLGITLVLVWLGIAQLAIITQGWELIGRSRQ